MIKKIVVCVAILVCMVSTAFAAEAIDFSYKGVDLGDNYDVMVEKLGEPIVDFTYVVNDQVVVYYMYHHHDVRVGMDVETGKIVDIRIGDKSYETDKGIKLGATPHKILKTYGKTERVKIGSHIYYVYHNEAKTTQCLYLEVDQGYLEEIRITNLVVK